MIKIFIPLCVLLGFMSVRCAAAEVVTLGAFLEGLPAQSKELKEIITASFEGSSTECGKPTINSMVGGTSIAEHCFSAFKKGKVDRVPDFLLFLEVATVAYNKEGVVIMSHFQYPSSIERRLIGFRVVAYQESEDSKLQHQ